MAISTNIVLGIFCLSLVAVDGPARQPCRSVRVAGVKSIFAMAPSPVGSTVLFYGSTERAEGEYVRGALFRLQLDATDGGVLRLNAPLATNPTAAVWRPDGSAAYFEADQGVYRLNAGTETPELLWKGTAAGLAISPNGALLAFWRLESGAFTLVVFDVKRRSEVRTWRLETRFGSDTGPFDLAFSPDGSGLYARTYDQRGSTPLKRFDIASGAETVVSPDCHALAAGKAAVYFVAATGGAGNLYKIGAGGRSSVIAAGFSSHHLVRGGNPRWLLSQDYRTKDIAGFDTQTDTIDRLGKHEEVGVLADGRFLLVNGAEITVGGLPCLSGGTRNRP
jgi:hypothetical protein